MTAWMFSIFQHVLPPFFVEVGGSVPGRTNLRITLLTASPSSCPLGLLLRGGFILPDNSTHFSQIANVVLPRFACPGDAAIHDRVYAPVALVCFIVLHTDLGLQQFIRANHYGGAFERRCRKIPEYRRHCARSHQSSTTASGWGVRLGVRPVPVFDQWVHMGYRSGMSDSHIIFFLLLCRKTCKSLLQIADGSHLRDTAYTWPTTSGTTYIRRRSH